MIIGNNYTSNPQKNFENSRFNTNNNRKQYPKEQAKNNFSNNLLTKELNTYKYTDPKNKNQMYDKSLAMLHERLENKTITLEEFNKKCEELAKRRNS